MNHWIFDILYDKRQERTLGLIPDSIRTMKNGILSRIKKGTVVMVIFALAFASFSGEEKIDAKNISTKKILSAGLKKVGNASKIKYKSNSPADCGALTVSCWEKVKEMTYIFDKNECYSMLVLKTSSNANAKKILKLLNKCRNNNAKSNYLSDYSSDEQKVFKAAICGSKGKYVWYIAMSPTSAGNKKAEKAIKKMAK